MEFIKEIYEKDIGLQQQLLDICYKVRRRAEAVVLNQMNQVALLYASRCNYHHLPGGSVRADEDLATALKREIREETGTNADVVGEVGVIIEYSRKDGLGFLQISYCYLARVRGDIGEPSFTEDEVADGLQLKWEEIDTAIRLSEGDQPKDDAGKFIQQRELAFLLAAKGAIGRWMMEECPHQRAQAKIALPML